MKSITAKALRQMISNGDDFQLIDVREEEEHFEFNIGGELIPLSKIARYKQFVALNKPVIFYCRKGIRSQFAIQKLMNLFPFNNLYNLTGGTEAWKKDK